MEYSAKLKIILVLINTAIVIVLVCFWTILAQESQLLAAVLVSSNILGSVQLYTTLVERHERQLAQPQLELAILKPRKYSNEILPSDQREKVQEVWVQSLLVTARNNAIDQLRVKVSVAGGTASYFRWGLPPVRIDGEPESDLEDIFTREIESFVTLVCDESLHLPIYIFLKTKAEAFLQLNTEGHRIIKLRETTAIPVDVEIQFLARNYTDSKPRRFTLHFESLDKLGLTERG